MKTRKIENGNWELTPDELLKNIHIAIGPQDKIEDFMDVDLLQIDRKHYLLTVKIPVIDQHWGERDIITILFLLNYLDFKKPEVLRERLLIWWRLDDAMEKKGITPQIDISQI